MKAARIIVSLVLTMLLIVPPAFAGEIEELKAMVQEMKSDYESRIKELESKIERLESGQARQVEAKVAELRNELKEEIESKTLQADYVGRHNAPVGAGGLVVKNPFGFGNVSLGGYFDMEYFDREGEESTFRQHRWVINIGAQLTDRISFNSEYEIEYGGPDSAGGDGEAKVEQAYVDYRINDAFNLRAGAILAPFGRYNIYHDSDLQDLTDRPLLAKDIIPTTWTEAGYGVFGKLNPTLGSYEDLEIGYELYAVNGLDDGFSDTGLGGARNSLKTDNNDNKAIVGRLSLSPFLGHELGVNGYRGEYSGTGDALTGIGMDTFNTFGPLEFITEYGYFDVEETPGASSDLANYFQGAYAQVNYHFWPKFFDNTFLGRGFDNPTFTLVNRYDWAKIHDDGDSTSGINEEDRYTIGLNYRPIDSFVVKLEYQFNHSTGDVLEAGDKNGFVTSVAVGF